MGVGAWIVYKNTSISFFYSEKNLFSLLAGGTAFENTEVQQRQRMDAYIRTVKKGDLQFPFTFTLLYEENILNKNKIGKVLTFRKIFLN